MNKFNYKNLSPFKWFILENFPFIEADFDALTEWQLFCKLGKEINKIINSENTLGTQMENVTNAFIELQNYINNYFNNLDITDEINNKLNSLVEDGTLTSLIGNYINPLFENFKNEVNNEISIIDSKLNSSTSGSPAGVYNSVEDLETADPNHNNIYIVSSNGNWYYYDTVNNKWTSGGVYQATSIQDNSIVITNLKNNLQKNIKALKGIAGVITQTGTIYNGNVGEVANSVALARGNTGTLSVEENDIISIPFANGYTEEYPTIPLLLILDENNIILQKYMLSDFLEEVDGILRPVNKFLKMPANAKLIRFSNYLYDFNQNVASITVPFKITEYNYNDTRINNLFTGNETIPVSEIQNGKLYSLRIFNYNLNTYNSYIYEVEPLEYIHLEHTIASANYLCNAIFTDNDGNITGFLEPYGTDTNTTVNGDFQVPSLSTKMIISQHRSFAAPIVERKVGNTNNVNKKNIEVQYVNGILNMSSNTQNIIMQNFGGNNLFMIKSFTNKNGTHTITTDMTPAPYIVNAVNNANGDRTNEGFTGGNHQWNNQGSGSTPTAEQISLNFYADDNIFVGGNVNCNKFTIIEINRVQANNTCLQNGGGRNVLEEKITYTFDGKDLKINVEITPLEEIIIKRYYGIQLANSTDYKFYADKIYDKENWENVPSKPYAIISNTGILAKIKNCGLGELKYNSGYKCIYSNAKAYYWLINDNNIPFNTNDIMYFVGSYSFEDIETI